MAWEANSLPATVAAKEWAAFCDHEYASPKTNVDAAWRNWVRKVKYTLPTPPPAPGKRSSPSPPSEPTRIGETLGTVFERVIPSAEETQRRLKELGL
jgi:hypothetical protein